MQSLNQTCERFAAGMIKFCERMGWGMLHVVLGHMRDRLAAGARADLLELAQIPFVKSRTARVLWENGLRSLRSIAEVEARDLVPILVQVSWTCTDSKNFATDDRLRHNLRGLRSTETKRPSIFTNFFSRRKL